MDGLVDQIARERFRFEWKQNFAVRASAGSGKTTAISSRLAEMAKNGEASALLPKLAVVTFTKKAASQIGQRARAVLLEQLMVSDDGQIAAVENLERTFFGTIHSFCLLLARRYGQQLGIHLNPTVLPESDEVWWEQFLQSDPMQFAALKPEQIAAFLRHVPLEEVFALARQLDVGQATQLLKTRPPDLPPAPSSVLFQQIVDLRPKGSGRANMEASQAAARVWNDRYKGGDEFLPLFVPVGHSAELVDLVQRWMQPLKRWLASTAAVLAAELSLRYRAFRLDRGIQTYGDQIEAALAVLRDPVTLDRIREEGWRIILDEAQDTDAQQFAVLVEITRPVGSVVGTWLSGEGKGPRPGHFCMVGDAQQAIYGARAEIRNFLRHLRAFERGDAGEVLTFHVTFRTPRSVITLLNESLPTAFGPEREFNLGLPVEEGAPPPLLQVQYELLSPGPRSGEGRTSLFPLQPPDKIPGKVEDWLEEEVAQLAVFLNRHGPEALGAARLGDICILAPRNDWLATARRTLEKHGIKVALQVRRTRQGDLPGFAWLVGLLAVVCDPENSFEWFGVLREVFGLSDELLAVEYRKRGAFQWDEPEIHPEALKIPLEVVRPFILSVDDGGVPLDVFIGRLLDATGLWEKLRAIDPSGAQEMELARLLTLATAAGKEGGSVRGLLRELLAQQDEGRAVGRSDAKAINLLTSHSAKGLEWPVVIPIGLWRKVGKPPEAGLRLLKDSDGELSVYFDSSSVPVDTAEARDRERVRELVRLLYVTLTRVKEHLIIPWHPDFGGRQKTGVSFAELWNSFVHFDSLPHLGGDGVEPASFEDCGPEWALPEPAIQRELSAPLPAFPRRVLPHELSLKPDVVRSVRHEATTNDAFSVSSADDALDYGLWWHETVEHLPWDQEEAVQTHFDAALERARLLGVAERGRDELRRFRASEAYRSIQHSGWQRLAELSVFAPWSESEWIDGVMDLVLLDPVQKLVRVVDWKTNRRRALETSEQFLARLITEYTPQLRAYGRCVEQVFTGYRVELFLYSTAVGEWGAVAR